MPVKKERVQCNVTKETLFVGVGGIGSDIVTRVAERCRGSEVDNIKFVAMDTNANDLKCVKNSKANAQKRQRRPVPSRPAHVFCRRNHLPSNKGIPFCGKVCYFN